MARIPEGDIERIKREIPLKTLVESYGVELKPKGKDLIGLCPFHDDKDPSLVVTPEKNLWNCLGACGGGGSVIDWVMKTRGVSFRHAVELLKETEGRGFAGESTGPGAPANAPLFVPKRTTVRLLDTPFTLDTGNQELLNQYVAFCHNTLKENPEGLGYLEKRNLVHSEMVEHFQLGVANRTFCYRLPDKNRQAGAEIRKKLQEVGIFRKSGHEHFTGSLVIPIFDEHNNVVELYGRKIRRDLKKGTPLHLYLPGAHAGVFNIAAIAANKEIILCEALIDALTFWCHGFRNVTASYGTNGFTDDHLATFKKYGTERVLIAYDRDEAGNMAAEKLSKTLIDEGIECFRIRFPMDMDVNDVAVKMSPADKSFKLLIRNALAHNSKSKDKHPTTPPLAAKEEKEPPTTQPTTRDKSKEVVLNYGNRRWRVRGLERNLSYEVLKVNVMASQGDEFHVDSLDLYCARHRATFVKQASVELGTEEEIIKKDLGRVLLMLEELQEKHISETLKPKKQAVVLSDQEKQEALGLLKDPALLKRILQDFETCGVVGEETNKLLGYLACLTRKLEKPLGIVIQSSSSAGKSWLMESILSFMPHEERIKYSAMTGQALFYLGETDIHRKILAIVEQEGAERASYSLKLLLSEGELSIASTGKDKSGRLVTHEYKIQGRVMLFVTSTSIDIDEELLNRCLILTVDESKEQTQKIHDLQRKERTLKGMQGKFKKSHIITLHQNAQRLLKPLVVVNNYAEKLRFTHIQTRTRRDNMKYLTLIDSIALLYQYQRPVKEERMQGKSFQYITVEPRDIEIANDLISEALGHSLDELPPQTRNLLTIIEEMVSTECEKNRIERSHFHFSRRNVREYCNWGNTRLKIHLKRLEEMEYLLVHKGLRTQSFLYELVYNGSGKDGGLFLNGLIDVVKLQKKYEYDVQWSGLKSSWSPPGRPVVAPQSGGGQGNKKSRKAAKDNNLQVLDSENLQKTHINLGKNKGKKGRSRILFQLSVAYAVLINVYRKYNNNLQKIYLEPVVNQEISVGFHQGVSQ